MLNREGFDLWADGYDRAVGLSDEAQTYPFAGYREVLGRIFRRVMEKPGAAVLDMGFGTGVLAARLYREGFRVFGQDFSPRMIELAREKMPGAVLLQGDFARGPVPALRERSYDFILSTYALHHLDHPAKLALIRTLLGLLSPGGLLLIGDVGFPARADLEACRREAGEDWDGEEVYFVETEMRAAFPGLRWEQVSPCAGLMTLPADAAAPRGTLRLYLPRPEEGWFRRKMLTDPATMAYNAPWFPPDGCIPDPDAGWDALQRGWIGRGSERFYAYLQRTADGAFVGDVNHHLDPERGRHDLGIVIHAPERGKGYGLEGLRLLAERAFRVDGVPCLHNDFEPARSAALSIHRALGFRETGTENGFLQLELTREAYLGQGRG
jgi:putative AdoMet-dependent methyltransferase